MKKLLHIPLIAALLLSSCTKDEGQQWGCFNLSLTTEVTMDEAVRSPETLPEEEYADYTVMLYREGELLWETTFDKLTNDTENTYRRVPAGEYLVYVENCTAEEAEEENGRPRYAGDAIFTVAAGRTTSSSVVCTMANAKVTLAYAADFDQYFIPWGLSVAAAGTRKISMDMDLVSESHDNAQVMYFNVSEDGRAKLTYTLVASDLELDKVMRYDVEFTVEKCKWNKVTMTGKKTT